MIKGSAFGSTLFFVCCFVWYEVSSWMSGGEFAYDGLHCKSAIVGCRPMFFSWNFLPLRSFGLPWKRNGRRTQ